MVTFHDVSRSCVSKRVAEDRVETSPTDLNWRTVFLELTPGGGNDELQLVAQWFRSLTFDWRN